MKKFEVGKTYQYKFIGDGELVVKIRINNRTSSFVNFTDIESGENFKSKINSDGNCEYIYPTGKYSMCPKCSAKNVA